MKLLHSFPPLDPAHLRELESILFQRFGFPPLPDDYKEFLLRHNGGHVSPGYKDKTPEGIPVEAVVFDTPLRWAVRNDEPVKASLVMFYVVGLKDSMDLDAVTDRDLYDLVLSNAYSREDFDVLPEYMMSIAKCNHPEAADMLCLSLAPEDYGAVYYYYEMWHFPANYFGGIFENRQQAVLDQYGYASTRDIRMDSDTGKRASDALKRVPFVKVADSFAEFLAGLRIEETE